MFFPQDYPKNAQSKKSEFENITNSLVTVANCFGILGLPLPVDSRGFKKTLKFAVVTLWVILTASGCIMLSLVNFKSIIRYDFNITKLGNVMFFSNAAVNTIYYMYLARQWSRMRSDAQKLETRLAFYARGSKISTTWIKWTYAGFLTMGLFEHMVFLTQSTWTFYAVWKGRRNFFDFMTAKKFPHFFSLYQYTRPWGIILTLIAFVATGIWNITDILLMTMSLYMTHLFKIITETVKSTSLLDQNILPKNYWREIRENYTGCYLLFRKFNRILSPLMIISFVINFYLICIQTLHIIEPKEADIWNVVYFWLSFFCQTTRFASIIQAGALLHEETRKPLRFMTFLKVTPTSEREIGFFQLQISSEPIIVTPYNLFHIKRSLLITIAFTIITYELVCLQNNVADWQKEGDNETIFTNATHTITKN